MCWYISVIAVNRAYEDIKILKLYNFYVGCYIACEIAFAHKVLAFSKSFCRFSSKNFFLMGRTKTRKLNTVNRFENLIFDRKPYFKEGYVFKFEKILKNS